MNRGAFVAALVVLAATACANGGPTDDIYGDGLPADNQNHSDAGTGSTSSSSSSGSTSSSSGSESSSSSGSTGGSSTSSSSSSGSSSSSSGSSSSSSGGGGSADCVEPNSPADCTACASKSGVTCQPNGCYGGYYCYTKTNGCRSTSSCQ